MTTPRYSKAGDALASDSDAERALLIAADERFVQRLRRALQRGRESEDAVRATVGEPRYFHPWRVNRM